MVMLFAPALMESNQRKSGSFLLTSSRRWTGPLWFFLSCVIKPIFLLSRSRWALYISPFLMISSKRLFSASALTILSARSACCDLRLYHCQLTKTNVSVTMAIIRRFCGMFPGIWILGLKERPLESFVSERRLIRIIDLPPFYSPARQRQWHRMQAPRRSPGECPWRSYLAGRDPSSPREYRNARPGTPAGWEPGSLPPTRGSCRCFRRGL